ncbi:MAG: transaldolase family protein [Candidatus Moranbacteria bacterium]|nr:transaldolase family protein [Candidatus Moranbacteria bacterium]
MKEPLKDGLLFLDTADLGVIEKYMKLGFVDGVTTNPTIMKKCGVTGGFAVIRDYSKQIAKLIDPLPLSLETSSPDGNELEILEQAREFATWGSNVNVKVTITDQNGKPFLGVIKQLAKEGIKVNATAMMNAAQGLLAAKVGAKYVSIFLGRVANMQFDPVPVTEELRYMLDRTGLEAQIIAASSRESYNVLQWWKAGAHIITVTPDLVKFCIQHPYTADTVKLFDGDAADWLPGWKEWKANHGK